MNFIIPMAGLGSRFQKAGYARPKMLLTVHGKTLLEWAVDSLPLELCSNLIFVVLAAHEDAFYITDFIRQKYQSNHYQISFKILETVTRGQAETVCLAQDLMVLDTDLLIFNIDTYFCSNTLKTCLLRPDSDGVLGGFRHQSPKYSYALCDREGVVIKTAEKIVISDLALTGLYHFKKAQDFLRIARSHIQNNVLTHDEFYIAPMYNELIKLGKRFVVDLCQEHWILGTPEELDYFKNNYVKKTEDDFE